jgi:lipopolysaccharide biosynthesis regulator YciM
MGETLLNLVVAVGILGASLVLTQLFVRKMYYRCRQCGALNAKRRNQCRGCGEALP